MTVWHAACTCAMGKATDPMAVVDSSAKVIGVSKLRVVDASAFPLLPPGHPQSTICKSFRPEILYTLKGLLIFVIDVLAEKIADMIKNGN